MEPESTKDIVQEKIKDLPKEIRDVLASDDLSTKIHTIGNKHHLHIDQIGTLEDEVVLTLIGLSEVTELPNQLIERIQLSKIEVDALVNDIDNEIFLPIQDAMKKSDGSKSVVMPSSAAHVEALVGTPTAEDIVPAPAAPLPQSDASKDTLVPSGGAAPLHQDVILSEPTVSLAPQQTKVEAVKQATPPPPPVYKADPYREPIE